MRMSLIVGIMLLVCLPMVLGAQAMPRMTTVEPGNGKVGDTLAVSGENLQKGSVADLFLTDGKNDIKCTMLDQTATAIKFRIPEKVKPGRFSLMILTSGKEPKLIEQPVKVTIDEQ